MQSKLQTLHKKTKQKTSQKNIIYILVIFFLEDTIRVHKHKTSWIKIQNFIFYKFLKPKRIYF